MKPVSPSQENATVQSNSADRNDSDYEPPRIESVISAEQMERENFYAGGDPSMPFPM